MGRDGSMRRWRRSAVVMAGAIATVLGTMAVPAQAAPAGELSDQTAVAATQKATSDAGQPTGTGVSSDGVSVPASGPARVVVTSPSGAKATVTAQRSDGSRVVDGAAVADAGNAKIVSQAVSPGVAQHAITIGAEQGASSYAFDVGGLPDQRLTLRPDGGVALRASQDGVDVTLGSVAKPWAIAADGGSVDTRFEVSGSTITQLVEPTAATRFPVVADPRITFGRSVQIALTGGEANAVRRAAAAVLGVGVKIGCTSAARAAVAAVGGPVGAAASAVLSLGCKYGEAALVSKLFDTARAHGPYEDLQCYASELLAAIGGKLAPVATENCSA
ncbi:hypothetical protein GCM10007298_11160 [Williamsia phyllosphaerae]|uniref:Uncharacterized protein n=2 Tax=Williamsia phyllosphaerae TaxID=885042 RepID=A0ABQ1UE53_9NOCA|nr:hypothetical protein GCM10007298_11160 [Williamsia phyllosphaerae]